MIWVNAKGNAAIARQVQQKTGAKLRIWSGDGALAPLLASAAMIVVEPPLPSSILEELRRAMQQVPTPPPLFLYDPQRSSVDFAQLDTLATAAERPVPTRVEEPETEWLIGESEAMQHLRATIRLVAPRSSTVLVTGETGTGKERVARAIHAASKRPQAGLVAVNCGALPESLIESELFGHCKGAFTGAATTRIGRFEQANEGTLFLDEIGELPLHLQAKLLRVLQERELQRLGSSETIKVDARIVAASNIDLGQAVAQNQFRADLYYRLNVVPIHVPALRDRASDVPLLADHFISEVVTREGLPEKILSEEAKDLLTGYSWPGNVRQLEHAIEMAVILSGKREVLRASDFKLPARPAASASTAPALPELPLDLPSGVNFDQMMQRVEKVLLEQALRACGGNRARTANMLGMKRTTLLYKMKALEASEFAA